MSPMLVRRATTPIAGQHSPLQLSQTIRRNSRRSEETTLIQEWLCLQDFGVMIDGVYGYATEQAVRDFQGSTGVLPVTGEVDAETFAMLTRPMAEALRPIHTPDGAAFGEVVAAYALQHLRQHAREVGGQNRGPWVRLYLHGEQRPLDPQASPRLDAWCAGFVSTLIAQAGATIGRELPVDYHTSCNRLGEDAKARGRFVAGEKVAAGKRTIPTGSLLLLRRRGKKDAWHHTGVVTQALPRFVRTIEGNSAYSTDSDPSGHQVCRQMRSYGSLDFIVLD